MSGPDRYLRRYVRIVSSDDAAWNGDLVQVVSYNERKQTYDVTPNPRKVNQIQPKESQFQLYAPDVFLSRYPSARVIPGNHAMSAIPIGCVVDFTEADPTIKNTTPSLTIDGPCRVFGRRVAHPRGTTQTIHNHIIVKPMPFDLVEFESMFFDGNSPSGAWEIDIFAGQVVFRHCAFINMKRGPMIGHGASDDLRITFEGCIFSHIAEFGMMVRQGCVHVNNCTFRNSGMGVVVKCNGYVDVVSSNFQRCIGGVVVPSGGEAVVNNCGFENMRDFAVLAGNSSFLHTCSSKATDCTGSALVIEGGSQTHVRAKLWMFKDCKIGVRIGNGTVMAQLIGNAFNNCKVGTYITPDAAGSVVVYTHKKGTEGNCVNLSGEKFVLYKDNMYVDEEPPNPQVDMLHSTRAMLAEHDIKYGYPVSAQTKKILAEAGLVEIVCAKCKTTAPYDDIFKKCARCNEARYCSKACQEEHWPAHYVSCRVCEQRTERLSVRGYVECDGCGKVESHTSGVPHNACGRCLGVFYCSKVCQKAGWAVHKKQCKTYQNPK